jgi:hypothetical protein
MSKDVSHKKDPRPGDDRNLVLVDQDFGQPDFEDRMWLFWLRNRVAILAISGLVVAGALGWIAWAAMAEWRFEALKSEARRAGETPLEKMDFARKHAGKPIAGVNALDAADQFYAEKKFTSAATAYTLARTCFPTTDPFHAAPAGRAMIGLAFCKLQSADHDGGAALLSELAGSPAFLEAHRAQACYSLAVLAVEKRDFAGARKWLDAMDKDAPNGGWAAPKQQLILLVPELAKPAAETTPATTAPAVPTPPEK